MGRDELYIFKIFVDEFFIKVNIDVSGHYVDMFKRYNDI